MPSAPEISVIVITYNRPTALRVCLESLVEQTFAARRFEVVVVDGSTEPGPRMNEVFHGRLEVRHLDWPNRGVSSARNRGAEAARAAFIAFIDDDCVAHPDWLERVQAALTSHPRCVVGGGVENGKRENVFAVTGQAITEAVDEFYNPPAGAPRFFPGLNHAVARELYLSIGGCDEGFGTLATQDRDFIDRWRLAGHGLVRCREAVVEHLHRGSLGGFAVQYFNYGRGAFHYHRLRRSRGSGTMSEDIELHRQLFRHFREPLRRVPPRQRIQVIALLALWQMANLAGFIFQATQENDG